MCLKINCDRCDNAFVVIFKTMYNKTIIRFGFCDIRNNQGRGGIIVLSKTPPKYRKLDYNKNKKAQKITHMLAVFVDHGIMAHNP